MKIKSELAQDVIIYILTLIIALFAILLINRTAFPAYTTNKTQMRLINAGVNIVDDNGDDARGDAVRSYAEYTEQLQPIFQSEVIIYGIFASLGLVLLVRSISRKIKLIENSLNSGVNNLEQLQLIDSDSCYLEITTINDQLNTAITNIRHKDQIRTELYENMVHDFVTPLHILQGNLELMNNGIDIDINILNTQVTRLKHLTSMNLITKEYNRQAFNSDQLEAYITILKPIYEQCSLVTNISPNISFYTKIESLYRIIDNIINNAVKHGKPTTITIGLQQHGDQLILTIDNDGKAIDKDVIAHLFQRNSSASSSGLGLDIVNTLAVDLGYQIKVESTASKTSFKVFIPIERDR